MSDQLIVERGGLEKKDKAELQAIVEALGGKAPSRLRKSDLIDKVLELSGAVGRASSAPEPSQPEAPSLDFGSGASDTDAPESSSGPAPADEAATSGEPTRSDHAPTAPSAATESSPGSSDVSNPDGDAASSGQSPTGDSSSQSETPTDAAPSDQQDAPSNGGQSANNDQARKGDRSRSANSASRSRGDRQSGSGNARSGNNKRRGGGGTGNHPVGPDGEPLADWEVAIAESEQGDKRGGRNKPSSNDKSNNGPQGDESRSRQAEVDPGNRRNRRRGRNRGREREGGQEGVAAEPTPVEGYLDLREEGYGFLRVSGYLPSKEDVYVSVKEVRQYGLRKGDHLTGFSRSANRSEKNPGFQEIKTVNGVEPEQARNRVRFEDLTPVFPFEPIALEMPDEPENLIPRIVDLVSPVGKGQRGLIAAPPKSGQTTVIREMARSIETNHPDIGLFVLLVDERPEEVTDMSHALAHAEVMGSTFDRPPEEHIALAELTVERAKRRVEQGEDVCLLVDGLTRLARAYNLAGPQSGRILDGGLDAGAIPLVKRFFGAARKMVEGGSLTILATVAVETGTAIDELIRDEFEGTANMELTLCRQDSENDGSVPPIDVSRSHTLKSERIRFGQDASGEDDNIDRLIRSQWGDAPGKVSTEALVAHVKKHGTNSEFLDAIASAASS